MTARQQSGPGPNAAAAAEVPRVLLITPAAFNRITGGGITFTNLFRGWPKDRIATVHSDPVPQSTEVCERYYRLTEAEIATWPILRPFRRAGSQGPHGSVAGDGAGVRRAAVARLLLRTGKRWLFGDGLPESGRLSSQLEDWIAAFSPQLIYTTLGGNGMTDLVDQVRRRFGLPLVVHFMDDWQSAIYRGGLLSWVQRRKMHGLLRRNVEAASIAMGICDEMCRIYEDRFGIPFHSFQNPVDTRRWARPDSAGESAGSTVRVLYTGSVLEFAQRDSLATCCQAVADLRRQGLDVVLDIYSPAFQTTGMEHLFCVDDGIRIHEVISDDDRYFRTLAESDILLLPVNFDPASIAYIRLSMPTKVPSYLVSGTPVLVYGPAEVAQVRYAREAEWGHVVEGRGAEAVAVGLRVLIEDQALRQRLSGNARRLAAERHDVTAVRERFQAALVSAGGAHGGEAGSSKQPRGQAVCVGRASADGATT